jgi:hypothetical protein
MNNWIEGSPVGLSMADAALFGGLLCGTGAQASTVSTTDQTYTGSSSSIANGNTVGMSFMALIPTPLRTFSALR